MRSSMILHNSYVLKDQLGPYIDLRGQHGQKELAPTRTLIHATTHVLFRFSACALMPFMIYCIWI
jgi:hypothetical protein